MPVRNGQAFLQEAIDSILAQRFRDFEFLIIDDGSSDATPALLRAAQADDRRIRTLKGPGDGIVSALNLGLAQARGEFVARMDADDIALPQRFDVQVTALEALPKVAALGSAAVRIDAAGRRGATITVPSTPEDVRAALRTGNPMLHPTVTMRRDAVLEAGGYRGALRHAEDLDLWLRLARRGDLANIEAPLLCFRLHGKQTSQVHRVDQAAAASLAFLLDREERDGRAAALPENLHEALAGYLRRRAGERRPVAPDEARWLERMLRAAAASGLLSRGEIWSFARRLVREGRLAKPWLLPIKLLLRR